MALVLALKPGDDFYVGDRQFFMDEVFSETHFKIRDASSDKIFEISDTRATEIMPHVNVSAGDKPPLLLGRVAIEAPKSILVLRGDKRRNPSAGFRPGGPAR